MEKNFLKEENEKLKCQLSEIKYKLEKFKQNKPSEYLIYLKDDSTIEAKVEEGDVAGSTWDGLISYGKVVVNIDEFMCAIPIKYDYE